MRRKHVFFLVLAGVIAVGGLGWFAILHSGLLQPSHWQQPEQPVPVIATRGYYKNGQLSLGRNRYGYMIVGRLAGMPQQGPAPRDLLIVIHGFNNTPEKAAYKFDIARESLSRSGFHGVLAGYSWDADTQKDPLAMTGYHEGLRNAEANGANLASFVLNYHKRNPATRIHLLGYSMGARLALDALKALDEDPALVCRGAPVDSVSLAGAALTNDEAELGARYGAAISRRTKALINYYSPGDDKLIYYFPLKEGARCLGVYGIEHPDKTPPNYRAVDASHELPKFDKQGRVEADEYGDNHSGYLGTRDKDGKLLDDGIMDLVARYIADLP